MQPIFLKEFHPLSLLSPTFQKRKKQVEIKSSCSYHILCVQLGSLWPNSMF
jgi:hypothetical protein